MRSRLAFVAALAVTGLLHGEANALTVPFTEPFATHVANWRNGPNDAVLTFEASGGPDGSSYASTNFTWFGFTPPPQAPDAGVVIFRGNDSANASGDAFVGNWITGGVDTVTVSIYNGTPVALTPFLRVAASFNFPGAVIDQTQSIAPGTWGQVSFDIDPASPLCFGEGVTCAEALANVGNIQFGTDAPAALVQANQAYFMGIDRISIVPEPSTGLLFAGSLAGLAGLGRRRSA